MSRSMPWIAVARCVLVASALPACFNPNYDAVRCSEQGECPQGTVCVADRCVAEGTGRDASELPGADSAASPDGAIPGLPALLRHDSVDDFVENAERLDQVQIEAWGAVGPVPRVVGALLARGVNRRIFTDAASATWNDLPADGVTSLLAPPFIGVPGTLDLSDADWTVWLEGEIWLEAGPHIWQLSADDDGFVDIASPPGDFARIAEASFSGSGAGVSTAPVDGWYPIRIALAQSVGDSNLDLSHQGPGETAFISLPAHRYRTRAPAALRGLLGQGFDDRRYLSPGTVALQPGDALAVDYQTHAPQTLGIRDGDTFAVRWSGQVRIDVAGAYTFRLVSDDGQRLVIDGTRVIDVWVDTPESRDVVVDLDVGWHDLAVDLRENNASASVNLSIVAGPDLVGPAIPAERVRPTLVRSARTFGGRRTETVPIPDNSAAGAIAAFRFDGPPGAVVTGIDITADLSHTRHSELEIAIRAPDGSEEVVVMQGRLPDGPGSVPVASSTRRFAGVAASGTWQIIVRDRVANLAGNLGEATIAVHHRGGESPVVNQASFESRVIELGPVVGYGSASWTARAPAGTSVVLRLRSCDAADACAAEAWSEPLVTDREPPIAPRRFVQYRVELGTSGDATPALDAFELRYYLGQ